jgi:CRP-like cAMP-binding protein
VETEARLIAELLELPSLSGLSRDAARAMLSASTVRALPAMATLFAEGEAPHHLCLVLDGQLQVTCASEDAEVRVVVGVARRGALLGEMGLLAGAARSATVRATENSRLLEIPGNHLQSLVESAHPAAWILLRAMRVQLVERLRTVDERVDALLAPSSPEHGTQAAQEGLSTLWRPGQEG